jgi:hypothetical protein
MSNVIGWMAAEAERPEIGINNGFPRRTRLKDGQLWAPPLPAHQFAAEPAPQTAEPTPFKGRQSEEEDRERERRT